MKTSTYSASAERPDSFSDMEKYVKLTKEDGAQRILYLTGGRTGETVYFSNYYINQDLMDALPEKYTGICIYRKEYTRQLNLMAADNGYRNDFLREISESEIANIDNKGYYSGISSRYYEFGRRNGIVYSSTKKEILYAIIRFKNGILHCDYTQALNTVNITSFTPFVNYATKEPAAEGSDFLNLLKKDRDSKYYNGSTNRTNEYYINGSQVTEKAFKEIVSESTDKENMRVKRESRIKFEGRLSLGEDLTIFGENGKILWLRNGDELWALKRSSRSYAKETRAINDQRKLMHIDEKDEKRYFEVAQEELEDMFAQTVAAMLTSITPTPRW